MKNILTIIAIAISTISSFGMELHMNFNDLVSNSHIILIGTCSKISATEDNNRAGIISTSVTFSSLEIVRENPGLALTNRDSIEINYLGGETENKYFFVGEMPHFEVGKTYLLFLLNDGQKYISPFIGSTQGIFQIKPDEVTGEKYVLDFNEHGVTAIENLEIRKTHYKILRIAKGKPEFYNPKESVPEDNNGSGLFRLNEFTDLIKTHNYDEPSMLKWKRNAKPMPCLIAESLSKGSTASTKISGDPLGACGYQDVYIGMEEVPSGWASAGIDDESKALWDVYMNIYSDSPLPTNGWYPNNGWPEIIGWPSSSILNTYFGYSWGASTLGVCFIFFSGNYCSEIVDSDIAFNPAFGWVYDWNDAYLQNDINYRNVLIHELGHTWGYQDGGSHEESNYDYDQPSVMHAYYDYIWEDGKEIHSEDAEIYRNLYDNQTTVKDVDDVGVESYYASNGLHNCYLNDYSIQTGQSFTINNITVENNSDDTQNDVHLRFYLSTNRVLSSYDFLVHDFDLNSRSAESRLIADYTMNTAGVPAGTYYVCARVSINGYGSDDRSANDITWSTFTLNVTGTTAISEIDDSHALNIFPNPAHDYVKVQLPGNIHNYNLKLFDVNGKLILPAFAKSVNNSSVIEIEVKDLPQGIYMLILSDKERELYKGKIVKQ